MRLAAAALASAAAGYAVETAGLGNKYAEFVAVGLAVAVTYAVALVLVRVPREDWELLAGALRRLNWK